MDGPRTSWVIANSLVCYPGNPTHGITVERLCDLDDLLEGRITCIPWEKLVEYGSEEDKAEAFKYVYQTDVDTFLRCQTCEGRTRDRLCRGCLHNQWLIDTLKKKVKTVSNPGTHLTHCCPRHGCKYHDDNCPIEFGESIPEYPLNNGCEDCEDD